MDESDVFIDVSKAIRRIAPATRYRIPKGEGAESEETPLIDAKSPIDGGRHSRSTSFETPAGERKPSITELGKTPPGYVKFIFPCSHPPDLKCRICMIWNTIFGITSD